MKKNRAVSFKYLIYDIIRFSAIPGLLWFRPKKYFLHKEDKKRIKGGALVISNHITLFDPMYLMLTIKSRRHHCICMDELFKNKFLKWAFTKGFLCIGITRGNTSIAQVKEIISNLKQGNLVTMFPEGKINETDEEVHKFKSGMVMMAMRGNAPIIPLYIKRRKHFYSRLEVAIGSPIDVSSFKSGTAITSEDMKRATEVVLEKEKELQEFMLSEGRKNK